MAKYWHYNSLRQAKEVLDHYENFILRCPYVIYIAIVENCLSDYSHLQIEIGLLYEAYDEKTGKLKVTIDDSLRAIDVYFGNFDINTIPSILPVPSEFLYKNADCKCSDYPPKNVSNIELNQFSIPIKEKFRLIDENKSLNHKSRKDSIINTYDDWFNYQYGGMPISNGKRNSQGTLGGVFKLLEYPGALFGITNWHLFSSSKKNIGDIVYASSDKSFEIGDVFWTRLDSLREVAFIKFNDDTHSEFSARMDLDNENWKIASPENNMKVKHYGIGSHGRTNGFKKSTIYSTNATVRTTLDTGKRHIFKNQLLIKDYSTNGDSGSLVITNSCNDDSVVGLNFAKMYENIRLKYDGDPVTFSIANNINFIFNHRFHEKQLVKNENGIKVQETRFQNKFTLINNKLSK